MLLSRRFFHLGFTFIALFAGSNAFAASLEINVSGLRNLKGNVVLCLTANPKFFPECGKDPSARKARVSADKAAMIRIDGVAPGTYAMSLGHDENANNKIDRVFGIPKEGFGFSRNPKIKTAPPKFADAAFQVGSADAKQSITLKYIF